VDRATTPYENPTVHVSVPPAGRRFAWSWLVSWLGGLAWIALDAWADTIVDRARGRLPVVRWDGVATGVLFISLEAVLLAWMQPRRERIEPWRATLAAAIALGFLVVDSLWLTRVPGGVGAFPFVVVMCVAMAVRCARHWLLAAREAWRRRRAAPE